MLVYLQGVTPGLVAGFRVDSVSTGLSTSSIGGDILILKVRLLSGIVLSDGRCGFMECILLI